MPLLGFEPTLTARVSMVSTRLTIVEIYLDYNWDIFILYIIYNI